MGDFYFIIGYKILNRKLKMLGPATQTYRLRWNNESSAELNLSESFKELRESSEFFDVSLGCSLKGGGARILRAHQMILVSYSTVFRDMLREHPNKKDPMIYLKGISFLELGSILDFMYNGEVNISQPNLSSFLAVAEELQIKGLQLNQKDKENINRPRKPADDMENSMKQPRTMEDLENLKRQRAMNDMENSIKRPKRPFEAKDPFDFETKSQSDRENMKRPQTFDDLDSFVNNSNYDTASKYETVDKYMNHDEFDAEKFLKKEKPAKEKTPKEKLSPEEKMERMRQKMLKKGMKQENPADPISTAGAQAGQSNQVKVKDENDDGEAGEGGEGREKPEAVDDFIETTDKTFVDKMNKKRIISRCKICKKEIRRDGIKKHIRGVHKEYITKMAGGAFPKEESGDSFPNFEDALNGFDMEKSEDQKPQEETSQDEDYPLNFFD